jgi:prepilin-type N-terminal cleavage/methylation domain-containing protein
MSRKATRHFAGFTIAELLIALAITAILLAAVAVAFNASFINYQENEDMFRAINGARQALTRITSQLRTANAVDPNAPINECSLITTAGDDITYRFDNSDNKLYLDSGANSYVLCDNVTGMTFTKSTATVDSVTYVQNVQVSITVASGSAQQNLSAAAAIRRNLQ